MAGKILLAVVLLFVGYACAESSASCDTMYEVCKEHAHTHKQRELCEEGMKICKTCPVAKCTASTEECWAKAKTHEDKHKCIDQWYKCGRCYCRWDKCNKHAAAHKEQNRCNVSVDVCVECSTHECDVIAEKCQAKAKTHADIHKCIDNWNKCGQCMCQYDACMAHTGDKAKCQEGLNLCKKCETKKCDATLDTCMKKVTTHAELHVCLDGWYACVKKDCHQ